jgi:hypothetical protein
LCGYGLVGRVFYSPNTGISPEPKNSWRTKSMPSIASMPKNPLGPRRWSAAACTIDKVAEVTAGTGMFDGDLTTLPPIFAGARPRASNAQRRWPHRAHQALGIAPLQRPIPTKTASMSYARSMKSTPMSDSASPQMAAGELVVADASTAIPDSTMGLKENPAR